MIELITALEKISEVVNSNETIEEQEYRNKMLLNEANSLATIAAFKKANKTINIINQKNYIIFIDEDAKTNLKIKDEIIKINNQKVSNIKDISNILSELNINDIVNIETNNGIKNATIYEKENKKIIGIMIASEYELDTDIEFKFDDSESGPSGGLMMTLGIYNYLTNDSLTNDRIIVGTGTIDLNGENSSVHVASRAIARDNSVQEFSSNVNGNNKCFGHVECDAIIMDKAKVTSTPKIVANDVDASLLHEAAIGKIAGEQLIKLMTLGLTEKQAEEQIISGFLK